MLHNSKNRMIGRDGDRVLKKRSDAKTDNVDSNKESSFLHANSQEALRNASGKSGQRYVTLSGLATADLTTPDADSDRS
jgi:hypothetical protein